MFLFCVDLLHRKFSLFHPDSFSVDETVHICSWLKQLDPSHLEVWIDDDCS